MASGPAQSLPDGGQAGEIAGRHMQYNIYKACEVTDAQLADSAKLFSAHYGVWGTNPYGLAPGSRVKLSPARLKAQYLHDQDSCILVTAMLDSKLIGQALATRFQYIPEDKSSAGGLVTWITQLVVDSEWRSKGVGASLCKTAVGSNSIACGLASSHPHAVHSLENAAGQRCGPHIIKQHARAVADASLIPYLQGAELHDTVTGAYTIDTKFYVDHTGVNELRQAEGAKWVLGDLPDGHEFFAFVFTA